MATLKGFLRFIYATDLANLSEEIKTGTISFSSTMTGDDFVNGQTQQVGVTEEALDLPGDAGSNPMYLVVNLDETNFVEIGLTGSYPDRINPGEPKLGRANGTIVVKANAAPCNILVYAWEE